MGVVIILGDALEDSLERGEHVGGCCDKSPVCNVAIFPRRGPHLRDRDVTIARGVD
tara:strand:- start:266 stop:433 length:168 start_codon:yes stop_codon:yes gene_type:complete